MPDVLKGVSTAGEARLAELYRTYAPLAHARARRIVGDEADDIVQEVFIRLIRKQPADAVIAGWIHKTTTNLCLDRLRFRKRRDAGWQERVKDAVTAGGPGALESIVADRELCRLVLARVDAKTRAVAALVYLDEMTQIEAAEALGVSRNTVAKRLAKLRGVAEKLARR